MMRLVAFACTKCRVKEENSYGLTRSENGELARSVWELIAKAYWAALEFNMSI